MSSTLKLPGLKAAREKENLTQELLAELAGVSERTIQRIEKGHATSQSTAEAIALKLEKHTLSDLSSDTSGKPVSDSKNGLEIDIAVDPVEGTNFVAKNLSGGISVLAIAEKNNLFSAPETYMEKIAIGKNIEKGTVDLDFSLEKNLKNLADAKNKQLNDLTVCLLNRDRHKKIIDTIDRLKVNKKLISDGDVAGALYVTDDKFSVDMFIGIGGGPEGVLAASALDSAKCFFQGRFIFADENEIKRAKAMGIHDLQRKYELNEIISGDTIFSATGITDGDILKGIVNHEEAYSSETLITHKSSNTFEIIKKNMETLST